MAHGLRRALVTLAALVAAPVATASAQAPIETNTYALVDAGHIAAPGNCTCIASPFNVLYRFGSRIIGGISTPLSPVPGEPMVNLENLAEDRRSLARRAEEGLAGDANASLSIGVQLSLESALVGMREETEVEAARWLHLAASQNHPDAFRMLGFRYFHGRGVPQNAVASAYWFQQGALRGDSISMVALGLRLASGNGVPQNLEAAVRWWTRARGQSPLAARFLGDAYACGFGVATEHARAVKEYKHAADAGELSSRTQLGHMYANNCAEGSDTAAVAAYEAAADLGDPEAQIAFSDMLRQGRGTTQNPLRAYTYARVAELRLPDGDLKTQAADRAKSAARQIPPEVLAMQERMVQSLVERPRSPQR